MLLYSSLRFVPTGEVGGEIPPAHARIGLRLKCSLRRRLTFKRIIRVRRGRTIKLRLRLGLRRGLRLKLAVASKVVRK